MEEFVSLVKDIERMYDRIDPLASIEGKAMISQDLDYIDGYKVRSKKNLKMGVEDLSNLFATLPLVTNIVKRILIETSILTIRLGIRRKFYRKKIIEHVIFNWQANCYPDEVITYHIGGKDRQDQIHKFLEVATMYSGKYLTKDIYIGWLDTSLIGANYDI